MNIEDLPDTEKLTDPNDLASQLEMMFTADAIGAAQKLVKQKQAPLADGSYEFPECEDCDEDIGEGRLKYAPFNTICIDCATFLERHGRRYSQD